MDRSSYLHEWLFEHADGSPGAPAIGTPSVRLSYAELAARVTRLAGHLAATGLERGDRVLVALPNGPAAVVVGLALGVLGCVALEASRAWGAEVLSDIARRSGVRAAIQWSADVRGWGPAGASVPDERRWIVVPGSEPDAAIGARAGTLASDGTVLEPATEVEPIAHVPGARVDDPALVLFTSGSTGTPRGVVQTHRNIDANTRSIVAYLRLTAADRALLSLPLFYCYGRSVLQTHLHVGGSVFLEHRTAFPRVLADTMAAERVTGVAGVPLTFEMFRRHIDPATLRLPALRYLTQAGGPMASETDAWVRAAFRPAELYVMYGQTEATARLAYLPPDAAAERPGSIGIAIPGVELRVVGADRAELPPGSVGELVARGANVTPGYLDDPAATAEILVDGWLRTGDLARRDADGFLYLVGRTREFLKIGGHRVSPVQIEQAVERHPDVAEAAVFGRPDALDGESPVAVVVLRPGADPADAELRRTCQEALPAYAVPVAFLRAASLPRNEAGKLLRDRLRREHLGDPPSSAGGRVASA